MDPKEINKRIQKIRDEDYDSGNWQEARTNLEALILELIPRDNLEILSSGIIKMDNCGTQLNFWRKLKSIMMLKLVPRDNLDMISSALSLLGWVVWKMGEKDLANEIWTEVLQVPDLLVAEKISALSGKTIYLAEKDGFKDEVLRNVAIIRILLNGAAAVNSLLLSVALNSIGIALAKIGEKATAERILREAMVMNNAMAKDGKLSAKIHLKARHQEAKNGYNLSTLIFLPSFRFREAVGMLLSRVIPLYKEAGATTDLAAAFNAVARAKKGFSKNNTQAARYELASMLYWQMSGKVDRVCKSVENMQNIVADWVKAGFVEDYVLPDYIDPIIKAIQGGEVRNENMLSQRWRLALGDIRQRANIEVKRSVDYKILHFLFLSAHFTNIKFGI